MDPCLFSLDTNITSSDLWFPFTSIELLIFLQKHNRSFTICRRGAFDTTQDERRNIQMEIVSQEIIWVNFANVLLNPVIQYIETKI